MSDGARIFEAFPLAGGSTTENQIASLRKLADMMEKQEAEIVSLMLVFRYYHKADNEDGYELRMGMVRDIGNRRPVVETPATEAEPEEPPKRKSRRK